MVTLSNTISPSAQRLSRRSYFKLKNIKGYLLNRLVILTLLFALLGKVLVLIDPVAGILDLGILTVGVFGLLAGIAAVLCSLWLQELLWQPFKAFRQQFNNHFDQLTSWQQCILYFSVFFLLLFAVLKGVEVVF
jgi:hypothetical protein